MKYSLHTALNVVDPAAYSGWEGWLSGPCNDAAALGGVLGLAGFVVTALINERATVGAYDETLRTLAAEAVHGDVVILHHSHHGGRIDGGYLGNSSETFCLSDGELVDRNWVDMLARFKPGVNVIVILDCCHAGGMDKARGGKARPGFLSPQRRSYPMFNGPGQIRCNLIVLPACRADETCVETQVKEIAEVHGAWSWAFIKELQHQRSIQGRVLVPELYESARRYCAEHFPNQHPRVIRMGEAPDAAWRTRIA